MDAGTRVTLAEVAAAAGVSRAAASLALRGRPGVGEQTRRRILEVAEELGYRVRTPGASGPVGTVGLLVKSRPADAGATNAFYAPVVAGVSRACAEHDLDLRLDGLAVDDHYDPVELPRMLAASDVDGVVVLGAFVSDQAADLFGSSPVVLVDGYSARPYRFPSVVTDNLGGTAAATEHLIGLGHRRIAVVATTPDAFPSIRDRRRGYEAAMAAAGLDPIHVDGPHDDHADAVAAAVSAVGRRGGPTALVAANDAVALSLLAELRDAVPREVSVVGFDDIEAAGLVRPRLTTVAVDKQAMGALAVAMLRHRVAAPEDPAFTVVQQARLVVRESSAPPRR